MVRYTSSGGSPEKFLAAGILVNSAIAFVVTRIPAFGLSGFAQILAILITSDLLIYALTNARILRSRRRGQE